MDQPKGKWLSPVPKECNICHDPITDHFIDGRTQYGPWAIMCRGCHGQVGYPLGTGNGQLYERREYREGLRPEDHWVEWVKVAG